MVGRCGEVSGKLRDDVIERMRGERGDGVD